MYLVTIVFDEVGPPGALLRAVLREVFFGATLMTLEDFSIFSARIAFTSEAFSWGVLLVVAFLMRQIRQHIGRCEEERGTTASTRLAASVSSIRIGRPWTKRNEVQ